MANSNHKKEEASNFLNEEGGFDFAKLLETNSNLLSSFVHQREDEGGKAGGTQEVSMPFAEGMAALRDALGLSMSYAPLNSAAQVQEMSLSAQANLGLEASQGLNMEMGAGNASNPFGSEGEAPEKKDTASYLKKMQGR